MDYYTDGELWVAHGDGWRTGVRCWHECHDAHIEIVYQEYKEKDCAWVDGSTVTGIDSDVWDALVKRGNFLMSEMKGDLK